MKKPSKKQAGGAFGTVIFVMVALLAVQQTAHNMGFHATPVSGESMIPTSYPGDFVIATPTFDDYKEGDIAIYRYPEIGTNTMHRIVNVTEDKYGRTIYIFKGDNNDHKDEPVYRQQIIAETQIILPTHKLPFVD